MVPTVAPLQPFFNDQCSSSSRPAKEVRSSKLRLLGDRAGGSISKPSNNIVKIRRPVGEPGGAVRIAADAPRVIRISDSDCDNISKSSNNVKIRKPEGESGRPGCGGYNLRTQLNWDTHEYKKLNVRHLRPWR